MDPIDNPPAEVNTNVDNPPPIQATSPNGDSDVLATLPEAKWEEGKTNIGDFFGKTSMLPENKEDNKVTAKPENDDKSKEENKEIVQTDENKTEDKPVLEDKKQVVNPATTVPPTTVSEDARLAELTEGERTILKRASKEAREFTLARLEDLKKEKQRAKELEQTVTTLREGRTPVPESYYENPNAYVLLPEYHQVTQAVGIANSVVEHWTQALAKVKAGEEYRDLGVDDKGNIIILNEVIPASPLEEAKITGYLNHAINQQHRVQQQQHQLQSNFQGKVREVFTKISEVQEKFYPKEVWNKEDSQQFKITQQVKEGLRGLGITPANPLFELFSLTTAALLMRNQSNTIVDKEAEKKARIAEVAKKAGPNGSATVNGGSATGATAGDKTKEVSFSDFKNAIRKSSVSFHS